MPSGVYKNNNGGWNNNKDKNDKRKKDSSERMMGNKYGFKKGNIPWDKGIKRTEMAGNKHPMWIIDRSKLKKSERHDRDVAYIEWRKLVLLRDNFRCKISNSDCGGKLEAHHILSWREYPELRYSLNNGIILCQAHHPRRWVEEKRLIPEFQKLVSVSIENI